jgi:uncharacterized membrane protein YbhN (UPF0104 family)
MPESQRIMDTIRSNKVAGTCGQGLRTLIFVVIFLVLVVAISFYLIANAGAYLPLLQISPGKLVAIGLLTMLGLSANGLINVYVFQALNTQLSLVEAFSLAASASLANQLPFPGGMVSRGVYLKQKHGLSYSTYLSAMLALFFCMVSASGFIGLAILGYCLVFGHLSPPLPLIIGFALMALSLLIFGLPLTEVKLSGKFGNWLQLAIQGWSVISKSTPLLFGLVALQTGLTLSLATRYWLAFQMLSQNISFGQTTLLASGGVLMQMVSFAPGGLGVTEAIIGGIATMLGFELPFTIAAVELDRLIATLVIAITGAAGFFYLRDFPESRTSSIDSDD